MAGTWHFGDRVGSNDHRIAREARARCIAQALQTPLRQCRSTASQHPIPRPNLRRRDRRPAPAFRRPQRGQVRSHSQFSPWRIDFAAWLPIKNKAFASTILEEQQRKSLARATSDLVERGRRSCGRGADSKIVHDELGKKKKAEATVVSLSVRTVREWRSGDGALWIYPLSHG